MTIPRESMQNPKNLQVLIVEDSTLDAELMVRELQRFGYHVSWERTDSAQAFRAVLAKHHWDVVLSDYAMPHFSGLEALAMVKEIDPDLSFILVSGTIGEEIAVEAMRSGANDYIMKDRMARLGPAVERELRETEVRRARRQAEEALKKAEEKYRNIFENAVEGIFQVTPEGRFLVVNPAMAAMYGYGSPEAMVAGITSVAKEVFVYPEVGLWFRELMEAHGEVKAFEIESYKKGGAKFWTSTTARAVKDGRGNVQYYEGTNEDITERKRIEHVLRESSERYRELADLLPQIVFEVDKNGHFTFINRHGLEHFGFTKDDINGGVKVQKTLIPEDCERMNAAAERLLQGETLEGVEFTAIKKDGTTFPVLSYFSPIKKENSYVGFRGIAIDLSDRKQLEEQLFHAQKMESIGTLAGGIAHDFNNLLTTILGCAQLILMKNDLDAKTKDFVSRITEAGTSAAQLTQNLLTFSRKQIMKPTVADVSKVIEKVQKMALRTIGENIELRVRYGKGTFNAEIDTGQIEQVIMNLIVNARDAMPEGGQLTIETDSVELDEEFTKCYSEAGAPGKYIHISVADTGTGMDRKTKERMFEPFFTTKEVDKGTGLGLSIVYGIIKRHNGYITVLSEKGKGTTIHIYLPVIRFAFKRVKATQRNKLFPEGNETILVAEDNPLTRKMVQSILEEVGYRVIEAVDGEDALRKYMQNKDSIDLVLLDVMMPKKNVRDLFGEIKGVNPEQKIVFMSGYARDIMDRWGVIDERLNFIGKPIMPSALLIKIREVLGN